MKIKVKIKIKRASGVNSGRDSGHTADAALVGGHAVGDFADNPVGYLRGEGCSEMIDAIMVAFLAGMASYLLVTSAHVKGKPGWRCPKCSARWCRCRS